MLKKITTKKAYSKLMDTFKKYKRVITKGPEIMKGIKKKSDKLQKALNKCSKANNKTNAERRNLEISRNKLLADIKTKNGQIAQRDKLIKSVQQISINNTVKQKACSLKEKAVDKNQAKLEKTQEDAEMLSDRQKKSFSENTEKLTNLKSSHANDKKAKTECFDNKKKTTAANTKQTAENEKNAKKIKSFGKANKAKLDKYNKITKEWEKSAQKLKDCKEAKETHAKNLKD